MSQMKTAAAGSSKQHGQCYDRWCHITSLDRWIATSVHHRLMASSSLFFSPSHNYHNREGRGWFLPPTCLELRQSLCDFWANVFAVCEEGGAVIHVTQTGMSLPSPLFTGGNIFSHFCCCLLQCLGWHIECIHGQLWSRGLSLWTREKFENLTISYFLCSGSSLHLRSATFSI